MACSTAMLISKPLPWSPVRQIRVKASKCARYSSRSIASAGSLDSHAFVEFSSISRFIQLSLVYAAVILKLSLRERLP